MSEYLDAVERDAMDRAVEGGLSAYVGRLRDGWPSGGTRYQPDTDAHRPTFYPRPDGTLGYGGCSCSSAPFCAVPLLIEWGDRLRESYEQKVESLAHETRENAALRARLDRYKTMIDASNHLIAEHSDEAARQAERAQVAESATDSAEWMATDPDLIEP